MLVRVLISLLLIFESIFMLGQQYATQLVKFDENDGFKAANYIGDVKSDSEGNIWIVDFNQVNKYDGISFKTVKPGKVNHNALLRFIEGVNGQKMVLDYSGLFYFIEGDTLKPYEYNEKLKELNIGSVYTDVFLDRDDRLHISYKNTGYIIVDEGEITRPLSKISSKLKGEVIILKKDGSCFVSFTTEKRKLAEKIYVLNEDLSVLDSIPIHKKEYTYPNSKTNWKNGRMYYSNGFGNYYVISKDGKITEQEFEHPIINLYLDSYDNLWVSTFEKGLYRLNARNLSQKRLLFPKTTSVLSQEDLEGGLWVYSYEEGLMLMPYPNYEYLNKSVDSGLLNKVSCLGFEDENLLITHSGKSIIKYNLATLEIDSIKTPTDSKLVIESIFKDSKSNILWLSQRGKLYYLINGVWKSFQTNKIPDFSSRSRVQIIGYDSDTDCNIAICDNRYFLFRDTTIKYVSPQFEDKVFTVCKVDNKTYVSTFSGVFLQEGERVSSLENKFPALKERAHSITVFNDQIFFAIKNRGLYSLKDEILSRITYNGLPIENALVFKRNEDSLWYFSNQGSFLLERNGTVSTFERLPKMVSSSIISNKYGVFWATLKKGVFYSPFKGILKNKLNPVYLKLNSIVINGESQIIEDSSFQVTYSRSFVQVNYQAITFKDWPVTYRYKMEGLNEAWMISSEKSIQFTNLPIGDYKFQLQAKLGEQVWSNPIQVKFVVLPPFWRKWWFILISTLAISLFIYWIISYRFRIIKREKDLVIDKLKAEQRALRAQMDPHFVFNVVASAQYLVMKEENDKAIEFLNMFSRLMRSILDHSNSNLISLEQEIKFLEDYIRLEHFRLEKSFSYTLNIDPIKSKLLTAVPPFIIQPFIENAIHHGLKNKEGEKDLYLEFRIEKGYLIVEVRDTGIGRENAGKFISEEKRKRKSHGIRIIKERLELHNNRKQDNIIYTDPIEGGTHVTVKIKLDQK